MPVKPTEDQIKEIEGKIESARKIKDPKSKEARDLYAEAIKLADKYFKIERPEEEIGEPVYDPDNRNAGTTLPENEKNVPKAKTTLGPSAFVDGDKPSARFLAACKIHEYAHASVGVELIDFTDDEKKDMKGRGWTDEQIRLARRPQFKTNDIAEEEVIAYDAMLKAAKDIDLSDELIQWIKDRKKEHYKKLSEEKQKKYKEKVPWIGCRIDQREFNDSLGIFTVPQGASVVFGRSEPMLLDRAVRISELVSERFEGSYERFFGLNPNLTIDLGSLRTALFGPENYYLDGHLTSRTEPGIHLGSPTFLADGALEENESGKVVNPCSGGLLRVRHAYSECQKDGFWHVVEDDYLSCPPRGEIKKFRVWDFRTEQSCKSGAAAPEPVGLGYKDLHGDATCQSPKQIGEVVISECVNGFWENATYLLYECLDGTKRISLPAKSRVKTSVACSAAPPAPPAGD